MVDESRPRFILARRPCHLRAMQMSTIGSRFLFFERMQHRDKECAVVSISHTATIRHLNYELLIKSLKAVSETRLESKELYDINVCESMKRATSKCFSTNETYRMSMACLVNNYNKNGRQRSIHDYTVKAYGSLLRGRVAFSSRN